MVCCIPHYVPYCVHIPLPDLASRVAGSGARADSPPQVGAVLGVCQGWEQVREKSKDSP